MLPGAYKHFNVYEHDKVKGATVAHLKGFTSPYAPQIPGPATPARPKQPSQALALIGESLPGVPAR